MEIYPTTQVDARWDIVATVSLAVATVRILINRQWYPADWFAPETLTAAGFFARTAILTVGGRDSTTDAKFLYGHQPLVEVTVNGQQIVTDSGMVRVVG